MAKVCKPAHGALAALATCGEIISAFQTELPMQIQKKEKVTAIGSDFVSKIDKFGSLVTRGLNAIAEAGRLLVDMVDERPDCYEIIIQRYPHIDHKMLESIERVGRKQIDPRSLLIGNARVAYYVQRLPFASQQQVLEKPIRVATSTEGDGSPVTKRISEFTMSEAQLVMAPDHIRTPEEQRAILQDRKESEISVRFKIEEGHITFLTKDTYTATQLEEILKRLKDAELASLEPEMQKQQIGTAN